jgi:hypothetical protein
MNRKRYSIFHVPVLAFFSRDLYADIALNWKGVNFLYLLLLLAVCWLPVMVKVNRGTADFVKNEAPALINQLPEITIYDGQVSIKETQPYYITAPDSGEVLAIIDTTGQVTSLEGTDAFCLLTVNKLITKENNFESKSYDLSQVKSFTIDSETVTRWLGVGSKFVAPAAYPFAVLGSFVYRIVQALIYAAAGLLFASICRATLSYAALIRLAVAAVSPCIIVGTILGLAKVSIPAYLYLIAALGLLFYATRAVACQQAWLAEQSEEAEPAESEE